MPNADRAYLRRLAGVFLGGLVFILATNLLVDPFATLDRLRISGFNAEKTWAHLVGIRADKSVRLALDRFEVLIFGSSRVAMNLDPGDPVFDGRRVFNAALHATSLEELEPVVDYALDRQRPDQVLLGIDFFMVSASRSPGPAFEASAFSGRHPAEVLSKRVVSWDVFTKSLITLAGNLQGGSGILGRNGFVRGPIGFGGPWNYRQRFNHMLNRFATHPETYGCFRYDGERMAGFGRVLARLRRSAAPTWVFVAPIHAEQQELIHALGLGADYERFKREATAVVAAEAVASGAHAIPFWDFTGYAPQNTEPVPGEGGSMRWYWESSHSRSALGALMVARMLDPAAPDLHADGFGARLRPETVDAHLARQRSQRQAWLAATPGVREGIQRVAERTAPARAAACARSARTAAAGDSGDGLF